jgi:hypothetical protein
MDILETLRYLRPSENVIIQFGKEPTLSNVSWVSQSTYTSVDNTSNLNVIWNEEANVYTKAPFTIPTQQECEDVWNSTVRNKVALKDLRKERDDLLAKTDKYAILDWPHPTPEAKQAWLDYRQALRDLPANTEDPANPVWPTRPDEVVNTETVTETSNTETVTETSN